MPFTIPAIKHQWLNADGTFGSGEVTFALSSPMTNGGITIVPTRATAQLDDSGSIAQSLASNVDTGTSPQSVYWIVTERIQGAPDRTYDVQVPSASAAGMPIELGSLMPFVQPPQYA